MITYFASTILKSLLAYEEIQVFIETKKLLRNFLSNELFLDIWSTLILVDPNWDQYYQDPVNPKHIGIFSNLNIPGGGANLPNDCIGTMSALTKGMLSKHSFY